MPGCQILGPYCGDGVVNATMEMAEESDDGNKMDNDGCEPNCAHTLEGTPNSSMMMNSLTLLISYLSFRPLHI